MSNDIFREIENTLGIVPGFFRSMPAESLEAEWALFKNATLETDSPLPLKVRELIGISAAAARMCFYCVNFHTALARLHGATDREIQDTLSLSRFGGSWSTYLNGLDYDHDTFLEELNAVGNHLSR